MERGVRRSGTSLQRTYYVRGHRVEGTRDRWGSTSWTCDCVEYLRSRSHGEPWCQHAERVAAAASIDRLLGAEGLTLRADDC